MSLDNIHILHLTQADTCLLQRRMKIIFNYSFINMTFCYEITNFVKLKNYHFIHIQSFLLYFPLTLKGESLQQYTTNKW